MLKVLGNGIGMFIALEDFCSKANKRLVRILLEIDLCEGLPELEIT